MTLLLTSVAAYLLVGMGLCVKGKLAKNIAYTVAITATYGNVPGWKVSTYRWGLRCGVLLGWPVFLLSS